MARAISVTSLENSFSFVDEARAREPLKIDAVVVCTILDIITWSLDPTDLELSMEVANNEAPKYFPSVFYAALG